MAILLVVAFHVGLPGADGGYIGVDVFFVVSGYLITSLLLAEASTTGRVSLPTFYARRVRRLFPALFVVVLATLVLALLFLLPTPDEQEDVAHSAVAASLYVANVYFLLTSGRYFDATTELKPLVHTWSLSVEEQFYLFWPALIVAVLWLCRRRGMDFQKWLAGSYLGVLLVSFLFGVWATEPHPRAAFYLMPARAWEFAAGGLLALWLGRSTPNSSRLGGALAVMGLAMILIAGISFDAHTPIPGTAALLPVGGACLLIVSGSMNERSAVYRLLTLPPVVYIGLLSYSWYLWHWPLLAITRDMTLQEPNLLRDAVLAGAALVAAHFTYRWVENPIRRLRFEIFRTNRATLTAGLMLTIASITVAGALKLAATTAAFAPASAGTLPDVSVQSGAPQICQQQASSFGLVPRAWCTVGDTTKPIRAVMWGDSHADQYYRLIEEFVDLHPRVSIVQRTLMGCTPIGIIDVTGKTDPHQTEACREYNDAVLREITAERRAGLRGVVLSGRWLVDFGAEPVSVSSLTERNRDLNSEQQARSMGRAARQLEKLVARLDKLGLRVLVIAPLGEMRYDIPKCLGRRDPKDCSVPRAVVDRQRHVTLLAMRKIVSKYPRAELLDPIEFLCDAKRCPAQRDGVVLYKDDNHISAAAAERLLPTAYDELAWLTAVETPRKTSAVGPELRPQR